MPDVKIENADEAEVVDIKSDQAEGCDFGYEEEVKNPTLLHPESF
jgi:hypothetical protein